MATKERVNELENALNLLGSYIANLEETVDKLRHENSELLIENLMLEVKTDSSYEEAYELVRTEADV